MGVTMLLNSRPSLTQSTNSSHRRCSRSGQIHVRKNKGKGERPFRLVAMAQACDDGRTIGQVRPRIPTVTCHDQANLGALSRQNASGNPLGMQPGVYSATTAVSRIAI